MKLFWGTIALFLVYSTLSEIAEAHGGGVPQLSNVEVGPYVVTIWTQPDPLRVGIIHFTVAVTELLTDSTSSESNGTVVVDAFVRIRLKSLSESGVTICTEATHENALNKLFFEADVDIPLDKWWQVTVDVLGPAGAGTTRFDIQVFPARTMTWRLMISVVLMILAAIVLNRLRNQRRHRRIGSAIDKHQHQMLGE